MIHLKNALDSIASRKTLDVPYGFIEVDGNKVTITVQDGAIKSVGGVNGLQVTEMLDYIKEVYKSLNAAFPCRENSLTITKIEEAIHWQDARTKDRTGRGVEGKNEE